MKTLTIWYRNIHTTQQKSDNLIWDKRKKMNFIDKMVVFPSAIVLCVVYHHQLFFVVRLDYLRRSIRYLYVWKVNRHVWWKCDDKFIRNIPVVPNKWIIIFTWLREINRFHDGSCQVLCQYQLVIMSRACRCWFVFWIFNYFHGSILR